MISDALTCAVRELRRRKVRTAITIMGNLLAVMAMVILASLLVYSRSSKDTVLNNLGTHFLAYIPAPAGMNTTPRPNADKAEDPTAGMVPKDPENECFFSDPARNSLIPLAAVAQINANKSLVLSASGFLLYRLKDVDGEFVTIGGFDPANPAAVNGASLQQSDIISGNFIQPGQKGLCLLEEGFALVRQAHLGENFPIGEKLYKIAGIVRPGIRPAKADVYMDREAAHELISTRLRQPLGPYVNIVIVEVASSEIQTKTVSWVKTLIPGCMIDTYACYEPAAKVMNMGRQSMGILLIIIFAGTILLMSRTHWTAINERWREIGILKAIGWTNGQVVSQIMMEALLQSAIAGLLGGLTGVLVLASLPLQGFLGFDILFSPRNSLHMLIVGLLLSLISGLLSAAAPALAAARQNPTVSLRH
ncbi:MAG: ABC transporter permease [Kiritimatiellaeota bacterium]|nr:ABC transporter permease [Kiritimatiellota bacterium]